MALSRRALEAPAALVSTLFQCTGGRLARVWTNGRAVAVPCLIRWNSAAAFNDGLADGDDADFITAQSDEKVKFRLSARFVERYRQRRAPFGYNGLGELVYQRTYSRPLPDGSKEQWFQTVERVVNGTYNMQKRWIEQHQLGWNPWVAQKSAQVGVGSIFPAPFKPAPPRNRR